MPGVADVVVIGGGAAGMAAAIAAARAGRSTILLESRTRIGGTVTAVQIHTLAGLYDSSGELLNRGIAAELEQRLLAAQPATHRRRMGKVWVLQVRPELYGEVVERWLGEERDLEIIRDAKLTRIGDCDRRITEIEVATPLGSRRWSPRAVIDATGTAEAVRLVDPALVDESGPKAAGGWIFRLRGVLPALQDPLHRLGVLRALRSAALDGKLPAECDKAWLDIGLDSDEVFIKLFIPYIDNWRDALRQTAIVHRAASTQQAVTEFLQRLPEFAASRVTTTGSLGIRDGGRIRGEYTLTAGDVRQARKFGDAACRCSWPIEHWDQREGLTLEYLPDGDYFEIPRRSLKVAGVSNLWAAGKCLSADALAQASARVVGVCWAMGEDVGQVAARSLAAIREPVAVREAHESRQCIS